jgi:tRNA isopentenyl-2-thiomethyl-A-37 hydroxylase MiaE
MQAFGRHDPSGGSRFWASTCRSQPNGEARHFGLYWTLAEDRYGREATVERLEALALVECEALAGPPGRAADVHMHSVGVAQATASLKEG